VSTTPTGVSAPPYKVEIVLPDHDSARDWLQSNRQNPTSPIYVDCVLNAHDRASRPAARCHGGDSTDGQSSTGRLKAT
jgi:hypothetical protein